MGLGRSDQLRTGWGPEEKRAGGWKEGRDAEVSVWGGVGPEESFSCWDQSSWNFFFHVVCGFALLREKDPSLPGKLG